MAESDSRRDPGAEPGEDERNGVPESLVGELRDAVREAALEVLRPAAREATSAAAKYAVTKGPGLAKNAMSDSGVVGQAVSKGGEMLSEGGGVAGVAGKLVSKVAGGGGGGGGAATGWGRNRRMPVQQWVYVSVPIRHAFNGWTEYSEWSSFMHRANQVDPQIDEQKVRVKVTEKMWGFTRPFTAEIVEQRPDERIRWESKDGTKNTGVINFHELGPRLTLIEVNLDHQPSGMVEKFARGARFVKRAVRADFHRFQAWIEMKSEDELEELEGWRGTIENGEIVKSHEDAVAEAEEEEREQGAAREEREDQEQEPAREPEAEYEEEEEEPEPRSEEEEYEEEREAEEEEEPEPTPRRRRRSSDSGRAPSRRRQRSTR